VVKILVDLEPLTGLSTRPMLAPLIEKARQIANLDELQTDIERANFQIFVMDRVRHLMQVRGLDYEEIQAVTGHVERAVRISPADLLDRAIALGKERQSPAFASVAEAFKRANNIVEAAWPSTQTESSWGRNAGRLTEPAELQLRIALERVGSEIEDSLTKRQPGRALSAVASIQPELARFFSEVRVMVDDEDLQDARLSLLAELRDRISEIGDISMLAPKQA